VELVSELVHQIDQLGLRVLELEGELQKAKDDLVKITMKKDAVIDMYIAKLEEMRITHSDHNSKQV
jgi:hypothetical protein